MAFVVCVVVLESGGLYSWAQQLELGRLRSFAVPVTAGLHKAIAPLGLERVRAKTITALARAGWSDDPAAAAAGEGAAVSAVGTGSSVVLPVESPAEPGVVPESKLTVPVTPTPKSAVLPLEGDPPLLSALPVLVRMPVEDDVKPRPLTVALAGDSMMAVGLSTTLLRQSPKYPGVKFVKAFKSGTGLARPEVFNWQQEYPAMMAGVKPDLVVVAMGANDGQGFVEDGVTYPFGGDGWQQIYQQRVTAFLQMLAKSGAQIVWLGLPPMKNDSYNERVALVNRIAYTAVKANPQATWFSTAGIIGDEDGGFRDFGLVGGKQVTLRQSDGIHFSDEGATLVTDKLLRWLSPPAVAKEESK